MTNHIAFISDLHLDPECPNITKKWNNFVLWAEKNLKELYILGDFFAIWAGDDILDNFATRIAKQLRGLVSKGTKVYFLPGNRDFLLGKKYAKLCGWNILPQQKVILINNVRILLLHGDELCTNDLAHQRFRKLSRNTIIQKIFLLLPKKLRFTLVNKIRKKSKNNLLTPEQMQVSKAMIKNLLQKYHASIMIHGHVHQSCTDVIQSKTEKKMRYVLSDWDDIPKILVYNVSTNSLVLQEYHE